MPSPAVPAWLENYGYGPEQKLFTPTGPTAPPPGDPGALPPPVAPVQPSVGLGQLPALQFQPSQQQDSGPSFDAAPQLWSEPGQGLSFPGVSGEGIGSLSSWLTPQNIINGLLSAGGLVFPPLAIPSLVNTGARFAGLGSIGDLAVGAWNRMQGPSQPAAPVPGPVAPVPPVYMDTSGQPQNEVGAFDSSQPLNGFNPDPPPLLSSFYDFSNPFTGEQPTTSIGFDNPIYVDTSFNPPPGLGEFAAPMDDPFSFGPVDVMGDPQDNYYSGPEDYGWSSSDYDWSDPGPEYGGLYARGGLVAAGRNLARQGRHGDTMLAHISPEEAEMLREAGGVGSINPETGLPEFFKLKNVFKTVLPIAGAIVGAAFGGPIGSAIGGGLGTLAVGGSPTEAAIGGGLSYLGAQFGPSLFGSPVSAETASHSMLNPSNAMASGSMASRIFTPTNAALLGGGALLAGLAGDGGSNAAQQPPAAPQSYTPSPYPGAAERTALNPNIDAATYGFGPEESYYDQVNPPAFQDFYARGGAVRGIGGGMDDMVPINASDGEHVVPAAHVAAIGDGSSAAGSKRIKSAIEAAVRKKGMTTKLPKKVGLGYLADRLTRAA